MRINSKAKRFFVECYNNVELYQQLSHGMNITEENIEDIWDTLPIVNKIDIINNQDKLIYPPALVRDLGKPPYEVYTSGTTGECLKVTWGQGDVKRSLSSLWVLRKERFGIEPSDKLCFFFSTFNDSHNNKELVKKISETKLGIFKEYIKYDNAVKLYELINKFSPTWMIVQPSIIQIIMHAWKSHGYRPIDMIKYIECTGEVLTQAEKEEIEEYFGCPVMNQYGTTEVNSIACSCEYGNLHVMDNNVIVEIVDDSNQKLPDDDEGNIIISSLTNTSMPFLRYRIGDRGRIISQKCKCGSCYPVLDLSYCRVNDKLFIDGEERSLYTLFKPIRRLVEEHGFDIKQFKIVEQGNRAYTYYLVMDSKLRNEITQFIIDSIKNDLGECTLEIITCEYIEPNQKNGKIVIFERK